MEIQLFHHHLNLVKLIQLEVNFISCEVDCGKSEFIFGLGNKSNDFEPLVTSRVVQFKYGL